MRILLILLLVITYGCERDRITIPYQEIIPLYTVFEEKDGLYCTDQKGMDSLDKRDEITQAYIDDLKGRIREFNR